MRRIATWFAALKRLRRSVEDQAHVSPTKRATASEVESEFAAYVGRVRKEIVAGALTSIGVIALARLTSWYSTISAAQSPNRPPDPVGTELLLAPLPAALTAAGFGLLATVAIGLQVAVRTPSEAEASPASALARRRFLCAIANIVVLASFGLGIYAAVPAFVAGPHEVDVLHLFGPLVGATLVAMIAADAGVAADPDFAPAEISRVSRARSALVVLRGIRVVGSPRNPPPRSTLVLQGCLIAAVPIVYGVASSFFVEHALAYLRVLLGLLALIVAAVVYVMATSLYAMTVARDWSGVVLLSVMAAALGMLLWLTLGLTVLKSTAAARSLAPATSIEAWALLYIAIPAALAAWALSPDRERRPRLLGMWVGRKLSRRLARRHQGITRPDRPPLNMLAAVSPWLSVVFPFGLIFAVIAKNQIAAANRPPSRAPQRGTRWANTAIVLSVVFIVLGVAGLFVAGAIDLPEWNDYMWGTPK